MKIKEAVVAVVDNIPKGSCYFFGISTGILATMGISKAVDVYCDKKYPQAAKASAMLYTEGLNNGMRLSNIVIEAQSEKIQQLENEISELKKEKES